MWTAGFRDGPITLAVRARPVRLAWSLRVDEPDTSHQWLDRIASSSAECWGGPRWFIWLVRTDLDADTEYSDLAAADPDVLFTTSPLPAEVIEKLWVRHCVGSIHTPSDHDSAVHRYVRLGEVPGRVVSSLGTTPASLLTSLTITDANQWTNRFFLHNFGKIAEEDNVASIALTRRQANIPELNSVGDALDLLSDRSLQLITPNEIASFDTEFVRPAPLIASALEVYIGDSVRIRSCAWNRRALREPNDMSSTLWIPGSLQEYAESIVKTAIDLRMRRWCDPQSYASVYHDDDVSLHVVNSVKIALSANPRLSTVVAGTHLPFGWSRGAATRYEGREVRRHMLHAGMTEVPVPQSLPGSSARGKYVMDILIERQIPGLISSDTWWHLPQRLGIADTVVPPSRWSRTTSEGTCATLVGIGSLSMSFREPHWESVAAHIIRPAHHPAVKTDHRVDSIRLSSEGQVLVGLAEQLGGLLSAERFINDGFWYRRLHELSARADGARVGRVVDVLERTEGQDLDTRARALIRAIGGKARRAVLTKRDLASRYKYYINHQAAADGYAAPPGTKWDDYQDGDLELLVARGVLEHGTERTCSRCGEIFWVSVDALRTRMACPSCNETQTIVSPLLGFRLGQLADRAFAGGAIEVLAMAAQLCAWHSFGDPIALPSIELMFGGNSIAEVDLIFIREGRVHLVEVKRSIGGLVQAENDIIKTARLSRFDAVILATPFEGDERTRALTSKLWTALGRSVEYQQIRMPGID